MHVSTLRWCCVLYFLLLAVTWFCFYEAVKYRDFYFFCAGLDACDEDFILEHFIHRFCCVGEMEGEVLDLLRVCLWWKGDGEGDWMCVFC